MPMSEEAAGGLRAAVEHNPDAAREVMYMLMKMTTIQGAPGR